MAVTAEAIEAFPQTESRLAPHLSLVPDIEQPRVELARQAEFESDSRERFNQWLGSLALKANEPEITEKSKQVNLLERLKTAKGGSLEALKSVTINVDTAVFEAMFKEGYVSDTYMDRNSEGEHVQFDQTNDSIHSNAIYLRPHRHPALEAITHIEALNRHRIEAGTREGKLKTHHFVAFSLVPSGVPEKELGPEGDGYFLDSLALNIQATTELPNGRIKIETGFMEGVEADENYSFEDRVAIRHDFRAIAKVYEWLGLEPPRTAQEAMDNGLLIPKEMMPNGVVDPMRWFSIATDEVLGRTVDHKAEDYLALKLESKRKEASLKDVRQAVLMDLLAATDELSTPMEAVQRMWDLVREHTLKDSLKNSSIDPKVFGRAAAPDIIAARYHIQNGNEHLAHLFMHKAGREAFITACGGGSHSLPGAEFGMPESSNSPESSADSDDLGPRKFTCSNGHTNIRPYNEKIPKCQHGGCKAKVKC